MDIKIGKSSGVLRLVPGWHAAGISAASGLSNFQRKRRLRVMNVARDYFSGTDVKEIAKSLGVTHQRVSSILNDAVVVLKENLLIEDLSPAVNQVSRKPAPSR